MIQFFDQKFYRCIGILIQEVKRHGVTHFPNALLPTVCQAILAETAEETFMKREIYDARVVEDHDYLSINLNGSLPTIESLGLQLSQLVSHSVRWEPNGAFVHRYHAGSKALGAHKDFSYNKILIASFTLAGASEFQLLDESDQVIHSWITSPGSLTLLRAPGLTDSSVDDRPRHRVLPPATGTRQALIFRCKED